MGASITTYLPRELLRGRMPLEHLPKHHRARKDIHLVVVLRVRVPQLWRLPIDGADQAPHHRACGLLDLGKTKICNLRRPFGCDENV